MIPCLAKYDMSVIEIQKELEQLPQGGWEIIHHFSDGCYARELRMESGFFGVGALHKTNHHWVLSKGKLYIKNGVDNIIISAPHHGFTKAGDKRAIFALEDSVFTTFHVTNKTDIDEITTDIVAEILEPDVFEASL